MSRVSLSAADVSSYPWPSGVVYAAELDSTGIVVRANQALRLAGGGALEGISLTELVSLEQRKAFEDWLLSVGEDWESATFSFRDPAHRAADDRLVWLRRHHDGHLDMAAEPAWREHGRLVEQVLQLNDDLISTQRTLHRRQRDLEHTQHEAALSARRIRQLERILLAGLTPTDFDEALQELLATVQELLPGQRAEILLIDETLERLVVRAGAGPGASTSVTPASTSVTPASLRIGEGVLGSIAASGSSTLIEDLGGVPDSGHLGAEGSLIGTPLQLEGQVIGVLAVTAGGAGCFSDADLRLLELVGERVALAIGQAQLREREQRMAETLQRTLLPQRLPALPALEVAARYRARTSSVGGDFYDAISLPGGRVGAAIGDITGKGLRAAATMGRLRAALHAYALDSPAPADVLSRLGRLAEADGVFATALYLVLDPTAGRMELASAGHPPPLCLQSGRARYLEVGRGQSPMLGLPVAKRRQATFELAAGATLLLYTDGLVERTHDIDEGLGQLARAAGDREFATAEQLCEYLLEALAPAGRYRDDVALLALRRAA